MSRKTSSIKDDFTILAQLMIPVCVAVNFVGGQLAAILKLPVYLDAIGTFFIAMLCGPWVSAVTGMLSNIVAGIANPSNFPFLPVGVIIGITAGFLAKKRCSPCGGNGLFPFLFCQPCPFWQPLRW